MIEHHLQSHLAQHTAAGDPRRARGLTLRFEVIDPIEPLQAMGEQQHVGSITHHHKPLTPATSEELQAST